MDWEWDYDHPERFEDEAIAELDAERERSDPFRNVGEGASTYNAHALDGAETDPGDSPQPSYEWSDH
jgi:hypothetical protein